MADFTSRVYQPCKEWIAAKINEGIDWPEIERLCVPEDAFNTELRRLKDDELFPLELTKDLWKSFVDFYKGIIIPVRIVEGEEVIAIDGGTLSNDFLVPTGYNVVENDENRGKEV